MRESERASERERERERDRQTDTHTDRARQKRQAVELVKSSKEITYLRKNDNKLKVSYRQRKRKGEGQRDRTGGGRRAGELQGLAASQGRSANISITREIIPINNSVTSCWGAAASPLR